MLEDPEKLDEVDSAYRQALYQACPELERAFELAQDFRQVVRERNVAGFAAWIARAEGSNVRELRRFELSLRQDEGAVRAALEYPCNHEHVAYCTYLLGSLRFRSSGVTSSSLWWH